MHSFRLIINNHPCQFSQVISQSVRKFSKIIFYSHSRGEGLFSGYHGEKEVVQLWECSAASVCGEGGVEATVQNICKSHLRSDRCVHSPA